MPGNSFGTLFKLTTFGESHGEAIGGVIDGCPAGLEIDIDFIQRELARRKPGQSNLTTSRKEDDTVKFLSGIFEGKTLGTPIGFIIENTNQQSKDYEVLKDVYRPSHADYTYSQKYGIRDYRGGGRSSARETVSRVVAGAIAKKLLQSYNLKITAYVSQVGTVKVEKAYNQLDFTKIEATAVRCPDEQTAAKMIALIEQVKQDGDTVGGIITCVIEGTPIGIGEPVFDKLHADLGKAMLSINAVKGFEHGSGFDSVKYKGSELNDTFSTTDGGKITTLSNNSGGIQGGLSNGQDIYFNVAFKPVASIKQQQTTVNAQGNEVDLMIDGRHDPCVLPRAVPIVESMAALVIADHILRHRTSKL